jgi:hypothetical protein
VLTVLDAPDWSSPRRDGDTTFYTRSVAGSSFTMIKSEVAIPAPLHVILDRLSEVPEVTPDMPAAVRDGSIRRYGLVVEPNRFNEGFIYLALESGSRLVSPRDFLMYRRHFEKDGTHYFVQASVQNDAIKPEVKGFVRGRILTQAFALDIKDDVPRLRFVAHADPAGSIPAIIYNAVAQKQGYLVQKLKKACLEKQ